MEGNTQSAVQHRPPVPAAFSLVRAMTVAELIERLQGLPQQASMYVGDMPLTKDDMRLRHDTLGGIALKFRLPDTVSVTPTHMGCPECCEHSDRCMFYRAEG